MTKFILLSCFLAGLSLTIVNIYGLSQSMRPSVFFSDELRFTNDISLSYEQALTQLKRKNEETSKQFSERITNVISQSIAHIHWKKFSGSQFNQLVPIWENYFLFFMGKYSGIPEFKKYHFANYQRSLKRGIGICGDASMIMSQVLSENNISNQILSFPGHIVTTAKFSDGSEILYDPDFGVVIPFSPNQINNSPALVNDYYQNAGYTKQDIAIMNKIFQKDYQRWNGVEHFITKKYYFEYITYALKWPLPIIMIILPFWYRHRKVNKSKPKCNN